VATKAELLDIAQQALDEGDEATATAAMDMIEQLKPAMSSSDIPVGWPPQTSTGSQPVEESPISQSGNTLGQFAAAANSTLGQFAAAANRGVVSTIDLLGTPFRVVLEGGTDILNKGVGLVTGQEYAPTEVPTLRESLYPYGIETNFMEPSPTRNIIEAVGQAAAPSGAVGGLIRGVGKSAPYVAQGAEGLLRGSALQVGKGTNAVSDVGLGVLSGFGAGAGQEVAGDGGALIGGVLSPVAGVAATKGIKGAAESAYSALISPKEKALSESDKIIQKLLQDAATGAGMSAKEVSAKVKGMGKEGMLADVDETFASLLKTSANENPNVRGFARTELSNRQEGQAKRIADRLDEDTGTAGLTLDEEINRVESLLQPKIKQLYDEAGKAEIQLSPKLNNMMNGETSLNKAYKNAQQAIKDIDAIGEPVTQMTVIDQTKKSLDDMIGKAVREGANEEAGRLIKMKKVMLGEVDQANPVYAQARQLASDKKSLQNAADLGIMFNKMKASELDDLVATMGGSERHMYLLGAKKALLDRIDGIGQNRDLVNSMFGKNGDVRKLKTLFKDDESFNQFRDTLKMEADWRITSNTVRGNSTTKQQMNDSVNAVEAVDEAMQFATSPVQAARISGKWLSKLTGNRQKEDYKQALERVGFILSQRGIEPAKVEELLKSGDEKRIKYFLDAVAPKTGIKEKITPAVIGSQTETQQ
jgi:hypothetical protein